jgi:hypothetical protein
MRAAATGRATETDEMDESPEFLAVKAAIPNLKPEELAALLALLEALATRDAESKDGV